MSLPANSEPLAWTNDFETALGAVSYAFGEGHGIFRMEVAGRIGDRHIPFFGERPMSRMPG